MKKNIVIACVIWIILTLVSFLWNNYNLERDLDRLAFQVARTHFQQIVLFRAWNAMHGGVYVPVTADTQPNPWLETEIRDIKVSSKLTLTKVNPAFMTRQVSEIAVKKKDVKFHITSLNPLRPENRPTAREEAALREFENGKKETGLMLSGSRGGPFFYMAPLVTEESCLACHAKQGYRVGDIRGGISIMMPFNPGPHILWLILGHTLGLFAGLGGIIFAGNRLDRAYSVIQRQALFDALTGIPNRRSFSERIMQEFNRSRRDRRPLSIIMGDIDHFKQFNDLYGHSSGDDCLRSVAQAIERTLKRPGDFCARYGGEEFIIILPDTAIQGAVVIAEEIRRNIIALDIPHEKSVPQKKVSISLGVAGDENNQFISHEDLLKMADEALYLAKENGRNRFEVYKRQ
ncbi:MAG TPA: diguanylate cyclase [Spirochaetota bacterium]|nr:diguanylate cyclase [Spirochaetota bacterium]HQO39907.1 diguanylate cyclase [Spirochaetota bacterium]